ncbi:LacI family DNA-binding transcriptional regulator [Microbacterium petrolearium]|jgi:DNA-binding LacI/PurR family transcriptional regulator
MPVTLRDVAEHAGVAIRTVSNVVSGYAHVSDQMRERVTRAIEELGYRPNPVARTLRTGRSGVLALVVPEIEVPFFSELAAEVITAASDEGFHVIIEQTGNDHARERELLLGEDRTMLADGLIFSPLVTREELLEMKQPRSTPLVLLGEHEFDGRFDHVAIDNLRAARDAVAHLIALGRRRIAAIGAQPDEEYETPRQRTAGYVLAHDEAGLAVDPSLLRPSAHYSRADGYAIATRLVAGQGRPDAIFCYSDLLAIGAMRAVFDAGLRVPEDIAIIGIDDIEEGRYARPSLSTVSLDLPFIAREAIARITARIEAPDAAPQQIVARHAVIARESTGRA